MVWTVCQYSKGQIDRAGASLVSLPVNDPTRDSALQIVANWRACHSYPLQITKMNLKNRARKENPSAMVAQRVKRLSSILIKLDQNKNMKLSQMQDIGGCRAVLGSTTEIDRLVRVYKASDDKHRMTINDYVASPKPDGYRSVHLVLRFSSSGKPEYDGQRIEIQIRSRLQHAWATAIETCQTFTGQALKSKLKAADPKWLRFFALMSSAIAARERCALVRDTPALASDRIEEIREIDRTERIVARLTGWNDAIKHSSKVAENAHAFLLELNTTERRLRIRPYREDEMERAQEDYLAKEKETEGKPEVQVVLVSTGSVRSLRKAYPNYYMDTYEFVRAIRHEISDVRHSNK